jgi:hypothetical protein
MPLNVTSTVYSGTTDFTSLAIGDPDRNGANEIFGSNNDGKIYRINWTGSAWNVQTINSALAGINKILIHDADNDGQDEIYGAGQDGHVYQLKWTTTGWLMADLGSTGSELKAMCIGDGNNDGRSEIYVVGVNGHVYEFENQVLVTPTPTPTLEVTVTPIPPNRYFKIYSSKINPNRDEKANIRWAQPVTAPVTITVYNMVGERIITLVDHQTYPAGQFNNIDWNGHNSGGSTVGSGIYIVHIKTDGYETYSKCAVVK